MSHAVADPRTHAPAWERATWNRVVAFRFEHPDKAEAERLARALRSSGECEAKSHHFAVEVSFPDLRDDRFEAATAAIVRLESLLAALGSWRPSWVTVMA